MKPSKQSADPAAGSSSRLAIRRACKRREPPFPPLFLWSRTPHTNECFRETFGCACARRGASPAFSRRAGARPRSPWGNFPVLYAQGFAIPWVRTKSRQPTGRGSSRRRERHALTTLNDLPIGKTGNRGRGGRRVASTAFSGHGHHPAGRRDHGEACAHGRPDRGAHPELRADVAATTRATSRSTTCATAPTCGRGSVGQAKSRIRAWAGRQVPRPGGREPAAGGHAAHLRARGQPKELRSNPRCSTS